MEDITQGVLAICGNSGARNKVAKKMKVEIVVCPCFCRFVLFLCQLARPTHNSSQNTYRYHKMKEEKQKFEISYLPFSMYLHLGSRWPMEKWGRLWYATMWRRSCSAGFANETCWFISLVPFSGSKHDSFVDQKYVISRFESISVRDHMTNLYAPRLIVEKTMTDQHQRQMSDQQRQESVGGIKEDINGMKAVDSKQKDKMERKQFRWGVKTITETNYRL